MSKARIIFILGLWVVVLPYLGFPLFWKNILFVFSGLGFMYIGYYLYQKETKINGANKKTYDNFRENRSFQEMNSLATHTKTEEDTINKI